MMANMPRELVTIEASLAELSEVAQLFWPHLLGQHPFCVYLQAEMGMGKTTLVSALLRHYGLEDQTPVASPTYAIVHDYLVQDQWFAHMDFYRAGSGFSLAELGVLDSRSYRGYFIEWPDIVPHDDDDSLEATHTITIDWLSEARRRFVLTK